MAEIETFMGVSATDIEKIMGVSADDIEKAMGVELVTFSGPAYTGQTFVCFGGNTSSADWNNVIDYKASTSAGDASDFGDMSEAISMGSAAAGGGRAVHAGGEKSPDYTHGRNNMEYITIASTGNTTDAGDLTLGRSEGPAGAGNGTRAIWAGGYASGYNGTMDYNAILSTGNASDFGDLNNDPGLGSGSGSLTRFLHSGGYDSGAIDVIDYVAFDTTGNASDFGDLQDGTRSNAGGISTEARIINSSGGTI